MSSALIKRDNPSNPTTGILTELDKPALREMSQAIFRVFRENFVQRNLNFIAIAEQLNLSELAGDAAQMVMARASEGVLSQFEIGRRVQRTRTRVIVFSLYQLCVECGRYDERDREDRGGIGHSMNEYLFGVCFNGAQDKENFRRFCDYMLMRLDVLASIDAEGLRATEASVSHGLDRETLVHYWRENKNSILPLRSVERDVVTANYTATYKDHIESVFDSLDSLASKTGTSSHGALVGQS